MSYDHPLDGDQFGLSLTDDIRRLFDKSAPVAPFYTKSATGLATLSQWHRANFVIDDQSYVCSEQYMMCEKARLFGDLAMARRILEATHAHDHKRMGQHVSGFDHQTWEQHRCRIVYRGNYAKFSQNKGLRKRLLSSEGTLLAEANPKDHIWGVGLSEDDPAIEDPKQWRGYNLLGYVLMIVRHDVGHGLGDRYEGHRASPQR